MAAEGESARRALVGDASDIAALAKDYVAALENARGGDALISRTQLLADAHAVGTLIVDAVNSLLIVGVFDGVIAGFAHVVSHDIAGEATSVEVDAMYIDPPLRRVGVGEAMIDEVLRYARDKRAKSIDVVALPGDGATKSFLEAIGFRARLLVMHRSTKSA